MSRKNEINPLAALILAGIGYRAAQQGRNPFFAIIKAIFGFFFVILGVWAIVAFIASFKSPPVPVAPPVGFASPASSAPAVSSSGIPAVPATTAVVDRLGRMLNDAAIVDATGTVIGMVHGGRPVHIIGLDGGRLRIRKHDGQEGLVATDSVVDVGDWIGSLPERTGSP